MKEVALVPGRLDYIIYSGSNLMLQNNYSLFTPSLPQDSLNAFDLIESDAVVASDHLPIVADFEFKDLTAQNDLLSKQNLGILKMHPNPSYGLTEVSFKIHQQDFVMIQLINQQGKAITILDRRNINAENIDFNSIHQRSLQVCILSE